MWWYGINFHMHPHRMKWCWPRSINFIQREMYSLIFFEYILGFFFHRFLVIQLRKCKFLLDSCFFFIHLDILVILMEVENSCEPKNFIKIFFYRYPSFQFRYDNAHFYMLYFVWTGCYLLSDGSWPISFQSTLVFVLFLFKIIHKIILF